jgi:hypothetical protein
MATLSSIIKKMEKVTNAYRILISDSEVRSLKPLSSMKYNMKVDLKELGYGLD